MAGRRVPFVAMASCSNISIIQGVLLVIELLRFVEFALMPRPQLVFRLHLMDALDRILNLLCSGHYEMISTHRIRFP